VRDAASDEYDCNIQQVKCADFDVLYYGLFFSDMVVVFRVTSGDIPSTPGYSSKQHRRNVGEGQFHISGKNYAWHRRTRFYAELTYDQLLSYLSP
jgi:hypothetical protein